MHLKTREEQKEAFAAAVKQRRDSGAKYCPKCFDRGFTGWNYTTHKYMACKCLLDYTLKLQQGEINAQIKAREEAEYQEFKKEVE